MSGYGEFKWKDGKIYIGYYLNDKKDGFGIYYWATSGRAYIGFWKNGRQDGFGKYINSEVTRFGIWRLGERKKWLESEKDIDFDNSNLRAYKKLFKLEIKDIKEYLI